MLTELAVRLEVDDLDLRVALMINEIEEADGDSLESLQILISSVHQCLHALCFRLCAYLLALRDGRWNFLHTHLFTQFLPAV